MARLHDSCLSTVNLGCCGQEAEQENEQLLSGRPHKLFIDGTRDPTERVAAQLGLDCYLLSHQSGLVGTDANGAISRLRFMLAHSGQQDGCMNAPHHQFQTKSSALKKRPGHSVRSILIDPPKPISPHEQQVGSDGYAASFRRFVCIRHCLRLRFFGVGRHDTAGSA